MSTTSEDRRRFLATARRGLAAVCLGGCGRRLATTPKQPQPRNLVLISIDTLRADHMGCYGYPRKTTPQLDALARKGARFVNCTSPSSWTVPAHLSIFTSLEPATHQCVYYAKPGRLNYDYETMAKIFLRNGFRTGAFTGGGFAGARHGLDVGFTHFVTRGRRFEQNLSSALDWLDDVGRERFLLFFHGFDAHRPYASRRQYRQRFRNGYQGNYPILEFGPQQPRPNPEDLRFVISQYDGEISMVDDLLAYFFKQLQRRNLLDTTLVVVLSDHGEEFYEHGSCDHIRTLYDEVVRVPWIMWGPSVPSVEIRSHVGTIDVLPTVLPLFGLQASTPMQGTDRSELLAAGNAKQDAAVYSFTGQGKPPYHLSSVRTNRWKLITNLRAGCPNLRSCRYCKRGEPEPRLVELYDLDADPQEQRDVAAAHGPMVARLEGQLKQRIADGKRFRRAALEPAAAPSQDYLRTLRSLGYVGGEDEDGQ